MGELYRCCLNVTYLLCECQRRLTDGSSKMVRLDVNVKIPFILSYGNDLNRQVIRRIVR